MSLHSGPLRTTDAIGSAVHRLHRALTVARSVPEACQLTCDQLVELGYAMPSVYLERGGRMRCVAMRGYWQVFDGIPPDAGILGGVVRTGVPVHVSNASASPDFLAAVPGLDDEVCVPLHDGDRVVGALNIESPTQLPATTLPLAEALAAELGTRIAQLGGPPPESPAERLVRFATLLSAADEEHQVVARALEAARDLAGLDTALLVLDRSGVLCLADGAGPLVGPLTRSGEPGWELIGSWVNEGMSCYSIGELDGESGHSVLSDAGASTFLAIPVSAHGERLGLLLAADQRRHHNVGTRMELLELLAAQVASCLQSVRLRADLRRRAASDPLTGLGHHGAFNDALNHTTTSAFAVFVLDVDRFKEVNDSEGHIAGDRALVDLAAVLSAALRAGDRLFRIGGDEFATVVTVKDHSEAQRLADRLVSAARSHGRTVSVGVALARDNDDREQVLRRADHALYAAKNAGRNRAVLAS